MLYSKYSKSHVHMNKYYSHHGMCTIVLSTVGVQQQQTAVTSTQKVTVWFLCCLFVCLFARYLESSVCLCELLKGFLQTVCVREISEHVHYYYMTCCTDLNDKKNTLMQKLLTFSIIRITNFLVYPRYFSPHLLPKETVLIVYSYESFFYCLSSYFTIFLHVRHWIRVSVLIKVVGNNNGNKSRTFVFQ